MMYNKRGKQMPKLIVTSRYLKSGSKKKLANYVKYIATREGSVPTTTNNETAPATKNQQELISSLLNDFLTAKSYLSTLIILKILQSKTVPYSYLKYLTEIWTGLQAVKTM